MSNSEELRAQRLFHEWLSVSNRVYSYLQWCKAIKGGRFRRNGDLVEILNSEIKDRYSINKSLPKELGLELEPFNTQELIDLRDWLDRDLSVRGLTDDLYNTLDGVGKAIEKVVTNWYEVGHDI